MNRKIVVVGGTSLILFVLLSAFFLLSQNNSDKQTNTSNNLPAVSDKNTTASADNKSPQDVMINSQKLANNYFVFEKSEYEKAKAANRPILLFFYANWCPTCARQEPINVSAFDNTGSTNLIAFRVNYNDGDTSKDEDNLSKELGITYQHNFRLFDSNDKLVDSFQGDTTESELKEKISKVN